MKKRKPIQIKPLNTDQKTIDSIADEFVGIKAIENDQLFSKSIDSKNTVKEESRFTIVIPSYLHIRIKKHCAIHSISIKDALTDILLKEFPES